MTSYDMWNLKRNNTDELKKLKETIDLESRLPGLLVVMLER